MESIDSKLETVERLAQEVVKKQEEYFDASDNLDKRIHSLIQLIMYYLKTRRYTLKEDGRFDSERVSGKIIAKQ